MKLRTLLAGGASACALMLAHAAIASPTHAVLAIDNGSQPQALEVYDRTGTLVPIGQINSTTHTYSLTGLLPITDLTGNLPVTYLNGGVGASSSTFLRGDMTWAPVPATPPAGSTNLTASSPVTCTDGSSNLTSACPSLQMPASTAASEPITNLDIGQFSALGANQTSAFETTCIGFDACGPTDVVGNGGWNRYGGNTGEPGWPTAPGGTGFAWPESTALGFFACTQATSGGGFNVCIGSGTLSHETTGDHESAGGTDSMRNVDQGVQNAGWGGYTLRDGFGITGSAALGFEACMGVQGASGPDSSTTTGVNNVCVGRFSLMNYTTASDVVAVGASAAAAITTGGFGVFVGVNAGASTTTAADNVVLGANAGELHPLGAANTIGGFQTLQSANGAANTVAFGNSVFSVLTGSNDIGLGNAVGQLVTSGGDLILIGRGAGGALTTQSGDIFIGGTDGLNSTAPHDTCVGFGGLGGADTTGGNSCLGYQALAAVTGANNSAFGLSTLKLLTTGNNNACFGEAACALIVTASNDSYFGTGGGGAADAGGNSGFGYNIFAANTGSNNAGLGANAAPSLTSGVNNLCLATGSCPTVTTGNKNIQIGLGGNGIAAGHGNVWIGGVGTTLSDQNDSVSISDGDGNLVEQYLVGNGFIADSHPRELPSFASTTLLAGTPFTLGGSTIVGSGASAVCASGHVCDSISGEITFTTGTGVSANGLALTVNFALTRAANPACTVSPFQASAAQVQNKPGDSSTTTLTMTSLANLVSSTAYTVDYVCAGD